MVKTQVFKWLICISFLVCQHRVFSQVISNRGDANDKHFNYEVKEIDEFFERFNDDPNSFIRGLFKARHIRFNISRQQLIRSLFNNENRQWDSSLVNTFVAGVTFKKKPLYLDFNGNNWYAALSCKFRYNGSFIIIPVIMKIETNRNKGAKWMIVAVGSSPLKTKIAVTEMAAGTATTGIISPTSYGTNFVSLKRALEDKANLSGYFEKEYMKSSHMLEMYNALLNSGIEFLNVSKIKYHFLLADQWIFTVENFPRETMNSGWLISSLQSVSPMSMEDYRKNLLSGNE